MGTKHERRSSADAREILRVQRLRSTSRTRQCASCPWKKSTVPEKDIPDGYSKEKHAALKCTIADPEDLRIQGLRWFACHETNQGEEQPCVGWVMNQLGPGNNIALRIQAMDGRFRDFETVGPQHTRFEDTLPGEK